MGDSIITVFDCGSTNAFPGVSPPTATTIFYATASHRFLRYSNPIFFLLSVERCVILLISGFEIPDTDAERMMRPSDIVQYVCEKEDVEE